MNNKPEKKRTEEQEEALNALVDKFVDGDVDTSQKIADAFTEHVRQKQQGENDK